MTTYFLRLLAQIMNNKYILAMLATDYAGVSVTIIDIRVVI